MVFDGPAGRKSQWCQVTECKNRGARIHRLPSRPGFLLAGYVLVRAQTPTTQLLLQFDSAQHGAARLTSRLHGLELNSFYGVSGDTC